MKPIFIVLAIINLSTLGYGLSYTIRSTDSSTTPVTLLSAGDSILIERGGTLTTAALPAITLDADFQTAKNYGTVSTVGGVGSHGIFNDQRLNPTISNRGTISTTGSASHGIFNDRGDNSIITNNGTIILTGDGSSGMNNDQGASPRILNTGTISIAGFFARGIVSMVGDNVVITNSGLISNIGTFGWGIYLASGDDSVVLNSGTIITTGIIGYGIYIDSSANSIVTNSGSILVTGDDASGMRIEGAAENSLVTNIGDIFSIGGASHGMASVGVADTRLINSGFISTLGLAAHGISSSGSNGSITNSGFLAVSGVGSYGIGALGSDVLVVNSGTVQSAQSDAIHMIGPNPTLALLRGSNIQGPVETIGDTVNLNVETGLNLALTLSAASLGYNALGIEAPFVLSGSTIGVLDPTGFALQPDVIADLSDTILDGIFRHRLGCCTPCGCGPWVQAIGSNRSRSASHIHLGYDNWQVGGLVGYDRNLSKGSLGLFVGVTHGEATVDADTQKGYINSYVGGVTYETCFCDTYIGLALTGGYVDWDNDRFVMNNLAPGGVERAQADIEGFFVSPEISLSSQFANLCLQPIASLTIRYAGFFPGGYQESGSATNFSVKDRQIAMLTTRSEIAIPYSNTCRKCCWSVEPYVGVLGRYQLSGSRVKGELLGESLQFDQPGYYNLVAFFTGFRGVQSFGSLDLTLNLEASFDSYSSTRLLGEGGVSWNF